MKLILKEKPRNPIIIEGFPGFGLVGTIATEFLIKHLNARQIGSIWSDELAPFVAVHENKIVEPLGIFYDKKNNLVLVHALTNVRGLEWKIADTLAELCKILKCKELISLEGVGSENATLKAYYYSDDVKKRKYFEKIGLEPLKEGIVMGVTGALMLRFKGISCLLVESSVSLADSKAAAKIIEVLDKYLGLKVDYKPLIKAAEEFEGKLKKVIEKSKEATEQKEKKELTYFG